MFDVSADELFDAIDRLVTALLTRHGVSAPPVDAVGLAVRAYGYAVREEEEDDDEPRRYGDRPKPKPKGRVLAFLPTHSETGRNSLAARACAKELIAELLPKLGVAPGTENKSAQGQLVGLIAPRLVLPTRWFATAARKTNADVVRLHDEHFPTVAYEWLCLRLLDLDEPCCIAIVDDGSVSTRRSNFAQLTKKLTEAEQACVEKVQSTEDPQTVRKDGWTARGWPIQGGPFNRIILRSVPDDL